MTMREVQYYYGIKVEIALRHNRDQGNMPMTQADLSEPGGLGNLHQESAE